MKKVLIAGVDHAMPKLFYFKKYWREKGYEYVFFGLDKFGVMKEYQDVAFIPSGVNKNSDLKYIVRDIISLLKITMKARIEFCELFYTAPFLQMILVLVVLILFNVKIISIYRGGEIYYWDRHKALKKLFLKMSNKASRGVVYKEMYMPAILGKNNMMKEGNTFHLANSIEHRVLEPEYLEEKRNILLFHNSFKKWRNPDFLIDVVAKLKERIQNFKLILAGYRKGEDDEVLGLIEEKIKRHGLSQYVEIYEFARNKPDDYYGSAKIFLLPSELVFCNYSLLEAMNYGAVPIVSDIDKDSGLIIRHAEDGYILANVDEIWSDRIYQLLTDNDLFRRMSEKANMKILDEYNSQKRFDDYFWFVTGKNKGA